MDRRELLRKGGAAALFAGLAGVLAQGQVVTDLVDAREAAQTPAKKAGLTKRLLIENKKLQRELYALRVQYDLLKQAFGDLSRLFESGGDWRGIKTANLEGMLELLMPWARQSALAQSVMAEALARSATIPFEESEGYGEYMRERAKSVGSFVRERVRATPPPPEFIP